MSISDLIKKGEGESREFNWELDDSIVGLSKGNLVIKNSGDLQ